MGKTIKKFYRKDKGDLLNYDELVFTGEEIGTTRNNMLFRISKYKDKSLGFFINTDTQGNFILTPKQIKELKEFLSSGLEKL
jgi:hypothetical protein